ncbi:MAG: alpha-amylase family glycosyl hydrolase [Flavobacteriales bacterium]
MVIYELFVRNFSEDGTFQAVEAGLDDIVALGADTLWVLPVHPSGRARSQGSHGSPFAVRDHMAVHPDHGTMEDVACLVANVTAEPVRVEVDLGKGIEARDVWTGREAENVQDLAAHEVRLFVSDLG